MRVLQDINNTFRSPALSTGNRVLKWAIWVTARIRFTSDEAESLQSYNFDDLISPLVYELYTGELELINSDIVENLTEHEISNRIERLRAELNDKIVEILESLCAEFEFQIEN